MEVKNGEIYITPKERMLKELDKAIEGKMAFVTTTELGEIPGDEYTINAPVSLPYKRLFFDRSFDEDLKMISDPGVRITRYLAIEYIPGTGPNTETLP